MYNPSILKDRIKARAAYLGISMRDLTSSCDIGINAISQIGKPYCKSLSSDTLCAIADLLECSTDYLLGREEMLTGDQCVEIADAINAGVSMSTLVNLYGIDVARCWSDLVHTAECIRREESFV